jgi:hypothetical protein
MVRTHVAARCVCIVAALALAWPAFAGGEAGDSNVPASSGKPFKMPKLKLPDFGKPSADPAPSPPPPATTAATLSPAERQMREDRDRFNKTVFGGMLFGAAAGAAVAVGKSVIDHDDPKQTRKNVLIGVTTGAIAGGVAGYVTAKKEQAGRNEVRALQGEVADVKRDNERLQAFIDSTNAVLAEGRARLAALSADVAAKRVSAQDAEAARKREEANIDAMKETLASAKKTRDQYTQAAAQFKARPQDKRDLDAEIQRMDKQVSQLEGNIAEYSRALAVSKA